MNWYPTGHAIKLKPHFPSNLNPSMASNYIAYRNSLQTLDGNTFFVLIQDLQNCPKCPDQNLLTTYQNHVPLLYTFWLPLGSRNCYYECPYWVFFQQLQVIQTRHIKWLSDGKGAHSRPPIECISCIVTILKVHSQSMLRTLVLSPLTPS